MRTQIVRMLKVIGCLLLALIGIIGLYEFRSNQPRVVRDELSSGMEVSRALDIVQKNIVSPYACIWYVSGSKTLTARNCDAPNDTELDSIQGSSGSILVIYKGFLDNSHFQILFGEKLIVLGIEELVYEDTLSASEMKNNQ